MTETFMAIVGFLSISAALLVFFCDPMLEGLARRCTARRIARAAYWEAYERHMRMDEVARVMRAVEGR